jgi:hypothetical protein
MSDTRERARAFLKERYGLKTHPGRMFTRLELEFSEFAESEAALARKQEREAMTQLIEAAGHLAWAAEVEVQGGSRTRSFISQHRAKVRHWVNETNKRIAAIHERNLAETGGTK